MKTRLTVVMAVLAALLCSCGNPKGTGKQNGRPKSVSHMKVPAPDSLGNAVYYWKTVFQLSDYEKEFLTQNQVRRMYVRFFDVDYDLDYGAKQRSVPIATTVFKSPVPEGIEVVPTVYITQNAIKMDNRIARVMYERIKAMCIANKLGKIREIQLDCDWTHASKENFFGLCESMYWMLHADSIRLSATIRLHQLKSEAPHVDRGVLMLYNTGSLYNPEEENSILKASDVAAYLTDSVTYPIPLSFAFPTYEWVLVFRNNQFQSIRKKNYFPQRGDQIREEKSSFGEIMKSKALLDERLRNQASGIILYHLDESNLKSFTSDEIKAIYE